LYGLLGSGTSIENGPPYNAFTLDDYENIVSLKFENIFYFNYS
jgi:hypothetical protein